MNPFDENGNRLNANYSVEMHKHGFSLIIESRGGESKGNPPRNPDYAKALHLHLDRMKAHGMVLSDIQVASLPALKMAEADRRITLSDFPFPLNLAALNDIQSLRIALGRASSEHGRVGPKGGNPTKKLKLVIRWPDAAQMTADAIEALLARPSSIYQEEPTADPQALEERALRVKRKIKASSGSGTAPPPPGTTNPQKASGSANRFVRDPSVVGWVLAAADGRCEVCGGPAPFLRASGEPYLEVHHVRPLAEGGPDTTDNTVACCPNCHRALHSAHDFATQRADLISRIPRLTDYPATYTQSS